ncbi:unnamed protein product, partial [Adineta steineri]
MASNHVEEDSDEDERKTNTDIGSYRRTKLKLAMIRGSILRDATPNYAKLDGAGLSDRDVPAIIQQTLRDKSFTILNLRKNRITSIGIGLLVQELKTNTTLQNLDISRNPIGDEGARYLAELFASSNQTLLGLSMGDADIILSIDGSIRICNSGVYLAKCYLESRSLSYGLQVRRYDTGLFPIAQCRTMEIPMDAVWNRLECK